MKYCSKCGKEIKKNIKFCNSCGAKLNRNNQGDFSKKEKLTSKKNKERNLYKYAVIILLAILIFTITPLKELFFTSKNTDRSSLEDTSLKSLSSDSNEIKEEQSNTEDSSEGSWFSSIFAKCGNDDCETTEDSDNCCLDCGCPSGYSCDGTSCQRLSECGNGVLEEGETSENCCLDAGCSTGETCQDNVCIELKPEMDISFTKSQSYGVSILYSKNGKVTIGSLVIKNTGNDDAKNIKIVLSSPKNYFSSKTLNMGTISKAGTNSQNIILNFNEELLNAVSQEEVVMDIKTDYYNSVNKLYSSTNTFSFAVYDKYSMIGGHPNGYVAFVTPHQNIIREFAAKSTSGIGAGWWGTSKEKQELAARWLFESMISYGIDYVNDVPNIGDYVQLPYETLKRRNGDCEDLAVFYASLLESIGMESRIILIPGHAFAGYINTEGYLVPVETTASNFNSALSMGISEWKNNANDRKTIKPEQYRNEFAEVLITNEPNIPLPDISKQIGDCDAAFTLSKGWVVRAPVTLQNNGDSTGAACVLIMVYANGQKVDEGSECWTLNVGDYNSFEYELDISLSDWVSGYHCSSY